MYSLWLSIDSEISYNSISRPTKPRTGAKRKFADFTLHWYYALAFALLVANALYFCISVCTLIWATLSKSNSVWDRRCAYLLLGVLFILFILFFVYYLMPFFYHVYNKGWASTIVSYLWKSLKFTTDSQNNKSNGADTQNANGSKSKAQWDEQDWDKNKSGPRFV